MAGHGSPIASRWQFVFRARRKLPIVCCCALWMLLGVASAAAADPTLRVRVIWGGGTEQTWRGTISAPGAVVTKLQPLGIEPDQAGSIWTDGRTIFVDQRGPHTFDGVDFSITAPLDTLLSIELFTRGEKRDTHAVDFKLADLIRRRHETEKDANRNWLLARRAPGDQLRVRTGRSSLVFATGEKLRLDIEPHLLGLPKGTSLRVRSVLRKHRSGKEIWEQENAVRSVATDEIPESLTVDQNLPTAEGVYDLVVTAERQNAIRLWKTVAERTIQLVVLDGRPRLRAKLPGASPPNDLMQEIDPTDTGWWRGFGKLPDVRKFPGLAKEPPSNGEASFIDHPSLGKMVELGPPNSQDGISWRAYPLRLDAPGQPHVLEIEYPSDGSLKLGVSIIEPNAAGKITPIGVDSAVHQRRALAGPAKMLKHRLIIWPRTKTPWVLLTNQSETDPARFGKIRLLGPKRVAGTFGIGASRVGYLPRMVPLGVRPATFADRQRTRLLAGYYEKPLFGENFSAPQVFDEPSQRSLDDWNTFYQGGSRLVEYLGHVGYNGLMLSVLADGSTIYPSDILQPTPKYDTGVFLASGQDPLRKDVLEMLLRMFDRNDLRLIPTLQFSTPLPELEARLRQRRFGHDGIELIGGNGRPYSASHRPREGHAPYYNPLNRHVQEAMLRVVHELVQRYADHPSLGGVAIQLSADGFAQLPSAAWGLDDVTFGQFEKDERVSIGLGAADRFAARAKYINSAKGKKVWLAWRALKMRDFYRQMQRILPPGAKLYLAGANMFDDPQLRGRLAPTLPRQMKLDDALLEVGIDCNLYRGQGEIVLLRPHWNSTDGSAATQAVERAVNQSPRIDVKFARLNVSGSLIHHLPRRTRLESFDSKGPFGRKNTFTWLAAQASPSGAENRRQLIHHLAALDAQALVRGGWMLPLGQEESTKGFMAVYRRLPAVRFETVPEVGQPVTVRTYSDGAQTYVYLVNDSAAPVRISLDVDAPANCRVKSLSDRRIDRLDRRGRSTSWTVELDAYDLVGATFSAPGVGLGGARVTVSRQFEARLNDGIRKLVMGRLNRLKQPLPIKLVANSGFEKIDRTGRAAAWQVLRDPGAKLVIDGRDPHSGKSAARLSSAGDGASLVSRPFSPPPAGQLWVSVWLRIDRGAKQPRLRLALEGTAQGRPFRRFAEFGPGSPIRPVDSTWGRYVLKLDDLPKTGRDDFRLRLDLLGAGEVTIDDCQILLALSKDEHVMLQKTVALAHQDLQDKKFGDCVRALEGYWPQFLEHSLIIEPAPIARRDPPPARPRKTAKKEDAEEDETFLEKLLPFLR